jgi:endogenous inhibitor of DNA gyrase (YacG/DUF329 family)
MGSESHRCPICKREASAVRAQNTFAPFCSSRCRTIDLGRWLDESYRIPAVEDDGDEGEEALPANNGDLARRR